MIITLKNGARVELIWTLQVMEYMEEYESNDGKGYSQIVKDIKNKKNSMKIINFFIYGLIRSAYSKPLTYLEVLRLVDMKDYAKITKFIENNLNNLEEFKKKDKKYTSHHRKKKKK